MVSSMVRWRIASMYLRNKASSSNMSSFMKVIRNQFKDLSEYLENPKDLKEALNYIAEDLSNLDWEKEVVSEYKVEGIGTYEGGVWNVQTFQILFPKMVKATGISIVKPNFSFRETMKWVDFKDRLKSQKYIVNQAKKLNFTDLILDQWGDRFFSENYYDVRSSLKYPSLGDTKLAEFLDQEMEMPHATMYDEDGDEIENIGEYHSVELEWGTTKKRVSNPRVKKHGTNYLVQWDITYGPLYPKDFEFEE